ncbi:T9SS type A sorting domain-containing protein [Empedobacter falsenii]|uniref:T9SS type A sorting domain-containing protein n=1 Tax=Empedobacter falsenii TaxID=343874 RepID=UPI002574A462|nr:T9SS type A sorting domain-containing protein [Empedobacter falsenii]MDM1061292.1 T9SS type A sorting domain-containing protein [Empedobacter falsenii]MDM1546590.1 T9SS type A sorting domain-containing protein [Empedobacter falsenii]
MKKNLLALFVLGAIYSASAQDTYIKDAVIVKVNPNTLFYNGGNVSVATDAAGGTAEKIINEGNIQIKGGFSNANTIGKNFVNRYTNSTQYGQLIIDGTSTVSGQLSIERSKINTSSNDYFPFGLPYQGDNVDNIFKNIIGNSYSFRGDCKVDVNCGTTRYLQTLLSWDIKQSEYDHVPTGTLVTAGANYTVNTMAGPFKTFLDGISGTKFSTYGKPNNKAIVLTNVESGIRNKTKAEFSELTWGQWKNLINNYNETYDSYLGNNTNLDTNARYAKNLHRFSNPFTSNIDLSDVSITNSWIKFIVNGVSKGPTETFEPTTIKFRINKLADNYSVDWNGQTGGTNTNSTRISAYLQKATSGTTPYFWAGNPDALIVKPFEYFEVDYYTMLKANNGGSNIVTANFNITDRQKTFSYDFASKGNTSGVYARSNNSLANTNMLNDENLLQKGLIAGNDFTQLELFLLENTQILGDAAYLVNSSFYQTGNSTINNLEKNPIFLYEEKNDGTIVTDAQTLLNQFNSNDYVGKPIRVGFNNLVDGINYTINLRLFEQSILNKVDNLSLGKYYLLDKSKNELIQIDSNTRINFTANSSINNQFELYWNEKPTNLGTSEIEKSNSTFIFKENINKFVRFEKNNTSANIEIYDLTGRLITRNVDISTNSDYKLNLTSSSGVYVVVITYKDGKVVSLKTIN